MKTWLSLLESHWPLGRPSAAQECSCSHSTGSYSPWGASVTGLSDYELQCATCATGTEPYDHKGSVLYGSWSHKILSKWPRKICNTHIKRAWALNPFLFGIWVNMKTKNLSSETPEYTRLKSPEWRKQFTSLLCTKHRCSGHSIAQPRSSLRKDQLWNLTPRY